MKAQHREWQKLYDTAAWKRLRTWRINNFPICECGDPECHRPSEVVHHVKPHRGDRTLFYDAGNLQALSKECHDKITAREVGFAGGPLDPKAPVATGSEGKQWTSASTALPSSEEIDALMKSCFD